MTNESEKARWAKLAGLPKVEEESKQQLDENVVGVGAINQIFPTRKPNDYEMAFEHFLGEMQDSKKDKVEEPLEPILLPPKAFLCETKDKLLILLDLLRKDKCGICVIITNKKLVHNWLKFKLKPNLSVSKLKL